MFAVRNSRACEANARCSLSLANAMSCSMASLRVTVTNISVPLPHHMNILGPEKLAEPLPSTFDTTSAVLPSAERGLGRKRRHAVHRHVTRFERSGHAVCTAEVPRPDVAANPKRVLFAMEMASSSVSNGITDRTGPKTSF